MWTAALDLGDNPRKVGAICLQERLEDSSRYFRDIAKGVQHKF